MHVVVTRERLPHSNRYIVHAYGPFALGSKAKSVKSQIKKRAAELGLEMSVHACSVRGDWDAALETGEVSHNDRSADTGQTS